MTVFYIPAKTSSNARCRLYRGCWSKPHKQEVRILYKRLRKQQPRLLAAGKRSDGFIKRRVQIDRL